jgi:hypothetical protein
VILAALLYRQAFVTHRDVIWWALYALLMGFLALRARRLKRRVADLVMHAAQRCELTRVFGSASKPAPKG